MKFQDLPPDLLSRCLYCVSAHSILTLFQPTSKFCLASSQDDDLWEYLFHKEKEISSHSAAGWRSKADSWLTVYRIFSQNQWLHGIWWLEESHSPDENSGWRSSRGALLQVRADATGLLGEMIRPGVPDDFQPTGLGLVGQELINVRLFDSSIVIRKRIGILDLDRSTSRRHDMIDDLSITIERGVAKLSNTCVRRGDVTSTTSESIMHGQNLERFLLRRSAIDSDSNYHDDMVPRCLSWVRVMSYVPSVTQPPPPLTELCGVWMGEYGSHGLQLLLHGFHNVLLPMDHDLSLVGRHVDVVLVGGEGNIEDEDRVLVHAERPVDLIDHLLQLRKVDRALVHKQELSVRAAQSAALDCLRYHAVQRKS